jgi:hypothetical protein
LGFWIFCATIKGRKEGFTVSNLKDIREIDTNMKELDSEKNLEVKWFKVDSKVIDNYMLGKGLKNGTFNRLDDSFVSDHVETLKNTQPVTAWNSELLPVSLKSKPSWQDLPIWRI